MNTHRSLKRLGGTAFIMVLVSATGLVMTAAPAGAVTSFSSPAHFGVGTLPTSVAAADVTGDGIPDLVTANNDDNTVSVVAGTGGGNFAPHVDHSTGSGPYFVVVADVTADGTADVITANIDDNTVSVLAGTGGGNFAPHTDHSTGSSPHAVVALDMTGDDIPDVVTVNYGDNTVSVLSGTGGGNFAAHVDHPTDDFPVSVVAADVTGDGIPDLITANNNSDDTVSVLAGTGGGNFAAHVDRDTGGGSNTLSAIAADVTGDGILDLVTTNTAVVGTVSVLAGTGGGNFALPVDHTVRSPTSVVAADVSGDRINDLVTVNYDGDEVSVLAGTGGGNFAVPVNQGTGAGSLPFAVVAADVTGDGMVDLVTANTAGNDVSVLKNQSSRVVPDATSLAFPATAVGLASATKTVTLTNPAPVSTTIQQLTFAGAEADSFTFSDSSCLGRTLPPGATCTVSLRFRPVSSGPSSASLRISTDGFGATVSLSGATPTAPTAGALSTNVTTVNYANTAPGKSTPAAKITATNTGGQPVVVSKVSRQGLDATQFAIVSETCAGRTLAPGAGCVVSVKFAPKTKGAKTAQLRIASNAPSAPNYVTLRGTCKSSLF